MSYYPEPDSHIRDKVRVVLDLGHYPSKKELNDAADIDISNVATIRNFIVLEAEVHKPDINKLVNVPTNWNNLKSSVDDLDVGKLKTAPADLRKLNDVVSKEVVKNTKFNTLNMKVNN